MSTWYLGPLGDMRPLVCPEPDVQIDEVRYGGIHQGLSGARTMDVLGHRAEYRFEFKYLDQAEWAWLEALHTRHVPGPFRLLNPFKNNRLSLQATRMTATAVDRAGVRSTAPYTMSRIYPPSTNIPGKSLKLENWTGDSAYVMFDPGKLVPVQAGEIITASVYVRADEDYPHLRLQLDWYDIDDALVHTSLTQELGVTTQWGRWAIMSEPVPEGAVGCVFSALLAAPDTAVYMAAPQVEAGAGSPWEIGGGAPEVVIDQVPVASSRFPLRNAQLVLLEA